MVHALLDAALQRKCLARAQDDDDDLTGLQHGLHTDGQRHLGDLFQVVSEEARVGDDGVVGQGLDTGARGKRGARLVEGDVAVLANAREEQVDAAGGLDGGLVVDALLLQVWCVAVENVDVGRADVDVLEEMRPHEGMIGLRVVARDANVLVLEPMVSSWSPKFTRFDW